MAFSHLAELCVASEFGGGGAVRQPVAARPSTSNSARQAPAWWKWRFAKRGSEFVMAGEFANWLAISSRFAVAVRNEAPGEMRFAESEPQKMEADLNAKTRRAQSGEAGTETERDRSPVAAAPHEAG